MLDRDTGARFDSDPNLPNLDRPLRPLTRDFLQRFRGAKEFDYLLLNQISGDKKADGGYVGQGELGVWGQRFVDRVYGISTPADADRLLLPWQRWSEFNAQLNEEYSKAGGGKEKYDDYQRKFAEAGKYLEKLDLSNKIQVVRDIIGKVIIKEGSEVEVCVHIPLQYQLATQKLGYEPIGRDCWFAKCWEINAFQRAFEEAAGSCGELPFRDN